MKKIRKHSQRLPIDAARALSLIAATAAFAMSLCAVTSAAENPAKSFEQLWNDSATAKRINDGIERNRKGDATIEVVDRDGHPISGATVEIHQKTHAFLFGCNLFAFGQLKTPELNRKYEQAFAQLFNFATVPFYWGDLEPEQGHPRYTAESKPIWRRPPPDVLLAWCKAHDITPKGHALMYSKTMFMPKWLDPKDADALKRFSHKRMAELADRYGRVIPMWDVVNEEIPRLAIPKEWNAVPNDYLAWCFQEAGGLFPKNVRLLINDGTTQAMTPQYEQMIQTLLNRGVRVEGVGLQFHIGREMMTKNKQFHPDHLTAEYARLGRLGLPLYITEITVPGNGKDGAAQQAKIVADIYRLWFSTPAMAGVTWWNLGDGTAFGDENKALGGLLDKDMNPKPAYQELDRLINHEWKTNLTATTNAAGKASIRGFYGKYAVTVRSAGQEQTFAFELSSSSSSSPRLTFKP